MGNEENPTTITIGSKDLGILLSTGKVELDYYDDYYLIKLE